MTRAIYPDVAEIVPSQQLVHCGNPREVVTANHDAFDERDEVNTDISVERAISFDPNYIVFRRTESGNECSNFSLKPESQIFHRGHNHINVSIDTVNRAVNTANHAKIDIVLGVHLERSSHPSWRCTHRNTTSRGCVPHVFWLGPIHVPAADEVLDTRPPFN